MADKSTLTVDDFVRRNANVYLHQAQPLPAKTPEPFLEEFGDTDGPPISVFSLFEPSPDHVNYVFLHSDEWASVVGRLRNEVWRRGVDIVPTHPYFCGQCGEPGEDELEPCGGCGSVGQMMPAAPSEKRVLEEFLQKANKLRESLQEVGERVTEEGLKHGRALVVLGFEYGLEDDGRIQTMTLKQVRAGDPGRIAKIKDKRGRIGGKYVCLACRNRQGYKPESKPGTCTTCHGVVYEAWWVEHETYANTKGAAYWLPDEVHEGRWPYKDGSSPATRLWNKLVYLLWDDRYAAQAVDPRVPQRPDRVFVTMGGDDGAIRDWARRDAEERKRNRFKMSHLHIPAPPGGLADLKMDAKVLDMGDVQFRLKDLERRSKFEEAIRNHYHVSPVQGGKVDGVGGLNNESQQLRSTAQVTEDLQRLHEAWLGLVAHYLGVFEWTYRFSESLEENEAVKADLVTKELDNAEKARRNGLSVQWRNNRAVISDGEVKPQPTPQPFGIGFQGNEHSEDQQEGANDQYREPRVAKPPKAATQAVNSDDDLTEGVDAILTGPSGAVAAHDVLWLQFDGLSFDQSKRIRSHIVASLTQPQGWSIQSIASRIQPILKRAGVDNPDARAELIARTETSAIASTWKERLYREDEARRGEQGTYRIRGANDYRRTKLSWWIEEQVGEGRPLDEVTRIMDAGIQLAKTGAFTHGGSLESTRGQPIRLPVNFHRRGFLCHYNDRDVVVEVV